MILYILTYHNGVKLEINSKRNYTSTWRFNNTLLNDQWVIEEIGR
jgi:phenolic acid decarboxylase